MKLITLVIVLILSSCAVGTKQIKSQNFAFKHSEEIKLNYSAAARCVIKVMELHDGLAISSMDTQESLSLHHRFEPTHNSFTYKAKV